MFGLVYIVIIYKINSNGQSQKTIITPITQNITEKTLEII